MNTFAAASQFGTRPSVSRHRSGPLLDEEAKIFLVGEFAVAAMAMVLAGIGGFIAANYNAPWAVWQSRMMMAVAAWAVYLVLKAWAAQLLGSRERPPLAVDCDFATGD